MIQDLPPGAKIVRLTIRTEPKLLKLNRVTGVPCPFESLIKETVTVAMIGGNYSSAVNNQREREEKVPDFEPRLLWRGEGERVEGSSFLVKRKNSDKVYLAYRQLQVLRVMLFDPQGNAVKAEDYKDWLPLPHKGPGQDLDKEVIWRTVSLENVLSVWYDGKDWL